VTKRLTFATLTRRLIPSVIKIRFTTTSAAKTAHGRGGLEREKINPGSVAEKVVQETQCPVFLVPLTRSDER